MENGARPAAAAAFAGARWKEKAPTGMRARVIDKIMLDLSKTRIGQQYDALHLRKCASEYEEKVFQQTDNAEDYLRTIGHKMVCLEQKFQNQMMHNTPKPASSSGPPKQQQAPQNQMQHVDAVLPNSSSGSTMPMPQTAPTPVPQPQNTRISVNQAQPEVAQLHHPCHQTAVTPQPHPSMNQQDPRLHHPCHQMQNRQCGAENSQQQSGTPHHPAAGGADWRDDMFLKITSLKDAHFSELVEYGRAMQAMVHRFNADTNNGQQPESSLSTDQAKGYRFAQEIMGKIKDVLNFLLVEKKNIPETTSFDRLQTLIRTLLGSYNSMRARRLSRNNSRAPPPPRVAVSIGNSQQNHHHHHEQHDAAEEAAVSPYSQNAPYGTPATHQQKFSDNFAGEAEADTSRFTGRTCSSQDEIHPAYEEIIIPQLTRTVEHDGTSPAAQQRYRSAHFEAKDDDLVPADEAERPVIMEDDMARSRSRGGDMGVNSKHAFHYTTSDPYNGHQNHRHEQQYVAEAAAVSPFSQYAPSGTPPTTWQQNHSDNVAGEAESPVVAVNVPGDTSRFTGGTCSQEIQQRHPAYAAIIPQLTRTFEHDGTSPAQQQTQIAHFEAEDVSVRAAEAERPPVAMEVNTARSFSPRILASDMGVNLKHAFHHTKPDTMDSSSNTRKWFYDESCSGGSCHKKQKRTYDTLVETEIRATTNMLVETEIKINEDYTADDGTLIELWYNAVSLTPMLREAVCASEISAKLLVPADYPRSSPVILYGGGERKQGVPGVVDQAFRRELVLVPEPRSIEGMAKAWDSVVRRVVLQFAHRLGGGTFSSRYSHWVNCVPV